jgi:4-diphosphocytidyl-2-C-methyl-D-erythritol kinase
MRQKSYAKVNIFLKITGLKEFDGKMLHTLNSRFMLVKNLYDTIEFVPQKCDSFTIEGLDIDTKDNIIYKAYKALNIHTGDLDILEFFYNHKVVVNKNIPFGAGLGGGSSNAATFMLMVKEACNLKISIDELAKIGASVGADVPFFIYGFESANVSGFGEIIEPFNENALDLEIFTPPIECNTALVYKTFDDCCLNQTNPNNGASLMLNRSIDILKNIKTPTELNDLYKAALIAYPNLKTYEKEGYYFSGSGSSFFRVK